MPSPFPGMNPYLEQPGVWPDFHDGYIHRLRALLTRLVVPAYYVRVGEEVYLHDRTGQRPELVGAPDLGVVPGTNGTTASAGGATATTAPFTITLDEPPDVERLSYLEVVGRVGDRVVTVIEVLSPSNKRPGLDRDQYLAKRRRLIWSGVNFVEIDLLRGGPRTMTGFPPGDYFSLVARVVDRPTVEVRSAGLRHPLSPVPIPLRPDEPEPILDLQAALHAQYDDAAYGYYLYRADPTPPLSVEDAAWARSLIPVAG